MQTEAILARLRSEQQAGRPVIVSGVGSGLSARAASNGGADLLAVYNVAVYRVRGLPTALAFLPYDNANELTMSTVPEVLANAGDLPVIIGLGAHDPRNRPETLIQRAFSAGGSGVTNEPFLGMYGEELRVQLDAVGLGFSRELALMKCCVESGGLALSWVFTVEEAQAMAQVGVQIIGVVTGVTAGGAAGGESTTSLSATVELVRTVVQAVKLQNNHPFVLGHGGPLVDPTSVGEMLRQTSADGYATGSTGERIPVELSIAEAVSQFKSISLH